MKKIRVIAKNTFRENIRNKILINLLVFTLLIIMASSLVSTLTIGERRRIIIDFGLAAINLFGVLLSVFVGISLVRTEIEKRTIYTVLSKPVHRYQFLVGRYIGLLLTLLVNTSVMTGGFFLLLLVARYPITPTLSWAIFLIFIELMVIAGIALMFSTLTSSFLAALFSLSLYIIGHLTEDLRYFGEKLSSPLSRGAVTLLYYLLPNLENFNIKGEAVHHIEVPVAQIALASLYGFVYSGVLITCSLWIFQEKDFR